MTGSSSQQARRKPRLKARRPHWTRSTARVLLVLLFSMTLAACPKTRTTAMPEASFVPCAALKPISFSASQDTEITVRQIREYNAVLAELCP